MVQIWLDCDGVLADFDKYFTKKFGLTPSAYEKLHGSSIFWHNIQNHPNFYYNLPLMPGARKLWKAVSKYCVPKILTGLPSGTWAEEQKLAWRDKYFNGFEMICTKAALKSNYCKPGDILIDDRLYYAHLWEEVGGIFLHHENATNSIAKLKSILNP